MDALVMAGGRGERMGGADKPALELAGRPMLYYVLDALSGSERIGRIHVAVSPNVSHTRSLVDEYPGERVSVVMTPGRGYVEDVAYAAAILGIGEPFLVVAADLPLITPGLIDRVVSSYEECGMEALSVRVRPDIVPGTPDLLLTDTGVPTVPAGINVVHGGHMDRAQGEHVLVVDDPLLAVNVNYRKDLTYCARLIAVKRGRG